MIREPSTPSDRVGDLAEREDQVEEFSKNAEDLANAMEDVTWLHGIASPKEEVIVPGNERVRKVLQAP